MKRVVYSFLLLTFIGSALTAQNLMLDKTFQIAFPDEGSTISSFFGSNRHDIFSVSESGEMYFLTKHYVQNDDSRVLHPTITKINNDFNEVWNTKITENYSLDRYSMHFSENGIDLYSSMSLQSNFFGKYQSYPVTYRISESGETLRRDYKLSGDTLDHFSNKFEVKNDTLEFIHSDSNYIYLSYMDNETFDIISTDTLLIIPVGDKVPYNITDWTYLDENNIILAGTKSRNFILVYNKLSNDIISLDFHVLKNDPGTNNIWISEDKIIVYSSSYITIINRNSLELISSIVPARLVDKQSPFPDVTSVDINENDEILLCIDTKIGSQRYYTLLKTDINFEVIWQQRFAWMCSGRYGAQARFLGGGAVALATVCDLSIRLQVFDNYPLKVNPEQQRRSYKTYPNPTDAYLYIDKYERSPMDYEIFDYAGKKVLAGTLLSHKIDVSALPAAAYIIVLDDGAEKHTAKFIVTK